MKSTTFDNGPEVGAKLQPPNKAERRRWVGKKVFFFTCEIHELGGQSQGALRQGINCGIGPCGERYRQHVTTKK